jgi:bifunctional non-homologous end joining protein LigD
MAAPFDHPDWLYELKIDGFRAVAYVEDGTVRLISRAGILFTRFKPLAAAMATELAGRAMILDGEVATLDAEGRSIFDDIFRRRGTPVFCAFDIMHLDGKDLTERPLRERKRILRSVVPKTSTSMLYVDHVEEHGVALFEQACAADLEGIIAKWADAPYRLLNGQSSWVKIKSKTYSQAIDRAWKPKGR